MPQWNISVNLFTYLKYENNSNSYEKCIDCFMCKVWPFLVFPQKSDCNNSRMRIDGTADWFKQVVEPSKVNLVGIYCNNK